MEYNLTIMVSWDDTYAIALKLQELYPDITLDQVSLGMVQRWVMELDDFADDNAIVNDGILTAIIQEWFEEANPL